MKIIKELNIADNVPREITIHTDSRITLQSLKNTKNHKHLIDEIRKKAIILTEHNWHITFTWLQIHVGQYVKELADKLAKGAIGKDTIFYTCIPMGKMVQQLRETILKK
jgi:ribonuclease HI